MKFLNSTIRFFSALAAGIFGFNKKTGKETPMKVSNYTFHHIPSRLRYISPDSIRTGSLAIKESFRTRNQRKRRLNARRLHAAGGRAFA